MTRPEQQSPRYFERYQSPFSYRYGSEEMRRVWSLKNHWLKARDLEIAAASVQKEAGIVSEEELQDLISHRFNIDIDTILRRELDRNDPRFTGHDVVSFVSDFSDRAKIGGRILHQGMTSEDLLSNVEILLIKDALSIIEGRLKSTIGSFATRIGQYKDLVCVGWTHDQAAEPITFGYRLARYAQDFLADLRAVHFLQAELKGKGIKGAVGTSASFSQLLKDTGMTAQEHEQRIMMELGIEPVLISGQTYPRKSTLLTVSTLALIGQSCHQFGADMKLLQASPIDEVAEPRGKTQVGSSAMPQKINPNMAEGIKALSRSLIGKVVEAWIGASEITLERGLEDSAGKRSFLPEAFLAADEVLLRTDRLIKGLVVRESSMARNLRTFGPFMALEPILAELSKKGANRQGAHELLRIMANEAMDAIRKGEKNPLVYLITTDGRLLAYLESKEMKQLFDSVNAHIGEAPKSCEKLLAEIKTALGN